MQLDLQPVRTCAWLDRQRRVKLPPSLLCRAPGNPIGMPRSQCTCTRFHVIQAMEQNTVLPESMTVKLISDEVVANRAPGLSAQRRIG